MVGDGPKGCAGGVGFDSLSLEGAVRVSTLPTNIGHWTKRRALARLGGVLDAVRIAGRWVSKHVLTRLTSRSTSDTPPVRSAFVRDFCRLTNWRNRKGQLCCASANVALVRLEKLGHVKLPAPAPRSARSRPRQLLDGPEALPPIPQLGRQPPELSLQLLSGQDDPDHGLWNRLIRREHPLKGAPLFGAQLRYLIRSPQGVLGGLGHRPSCLQFGLPRSMDRMGSDHPSGPSGSSDRVVTFSHSPGHPQPQSGFALLSTAVGSGGPRLAGALRHPTGLLETFVDRSAQTGQSLSAANWRRLGQSQGRGRSSPSARCAPKPPKMFGSLNCKSKPGSFCCAVRNLWWRRAPSFMARAPTAG